MANKETALVLRVTACDGTSYGGFKWPLKAGAEVVAPDWKANEECGNGLHGWLYGNGDHSAADIADDSQWMVVEVTLADVVTLNGKVKFPRCVVRFVGDRKSATDYLIANEPRANSVIGATVSGGNGATVSGGYGATVSGGDRATVSGGNWATVSGGNGATVSGGNWATVSGGNGATVSGGYGAEVRIRYYDSKADRMRARVGYIGEDGLKANTPYRLNDKHEFEEVK